MKNALIIGILFVSISGQALSMGHPHNLFAARKQMRAKSSSLVMKSKSAVASGCQATVQFDKAAFGKRLVVALSKFRTGQPY